MKKKILSNILDGMKSPKDSKAETSSPTNKLSSSKKVSIPRYETNVVPPILNLAKNESSYDNNESSYDDEDEIIGLA